MGVQFIYGFLILGELQEKFIVDLHLITYGLTTVIILNYYYYFTILQKHEPFLKLEDM